MKNLRNEHNLIDSYIDELLKQQKVECRIDITKLAKKKFLYLSVPGNVVAVEAPVPLEVHAAALEPARAGLPPPGAGQLV